MINLRGKAALITGASKGIGRATAIAFAEAGADVAVHYWRDEEGAHKTAQDAALLGANAITLRGDLSEWTEAARVLDEAWEHLGKIDVLVANHGVWTDMPIPVEHLTEEEYDRTMDTNVRGTIAIVGAAVRRMKTGGIPGRIILVGSTAAQRGESLHAHYAASKGAIVSLTKSLAAELAEARILVNCVAPGWVRTPMTETVLGDARQRERIETTIPIGRIAEPEEIAGPIAFLASDLASFVTGEILNVNGGSVLCG